MEIKDPTLLNTLLLFQLTIMSKQQNIFHNKLS